MLYAVKPGDSLWRIAQNFGVSMNSIREGNNIETGARVAPGDTLKVVK